MRIAPIWGEIREVTGSERTRRLARRLRGLGLRLTGPRLAILDTIEQDTTHPTADRPARGSTGADRTRSMHDRSETPTRAPRRRFDMAELKGTRTHRNLKEAFAGESQANRRYLYFAKAADIEGYPEIAGLFRDTAEGETGHAHGHLDYLRQVGDPATEMAIGDVEQMLASAVAGETHEYTDMYPGMAKTAREEGFPEIADWFETLAKAERSHAGKFQKALDDV
jgi:rubrerythrin